MKITRYWHYDISPNNILRAGGDDGGDDGGEIVKEVKSSDILWHFTCGDSNGRFVSFFWKLCFLVLETLYILKRDRR